MSELAKSVLDDEDVTELPPKNKAVSCLKENWFMIATIIGVIIGFGAGFGVQSVGLSDEGQLWLGMIGTLYIRLLQLTILPMIASNVINVMANLNPKENGKLTIVTLVYILLCNLISALIGTAYGYIIKPGVSLTPPEGPPVEKPDESESTNQISYIFRDLFLNIFPDNIVGVALFQSGTDYDNPVKDPRNYTVYNAVVLEGTNMIGVLFCALVFGMSCNAAKEKGIPFKRFFGSLGDVTMLLMQKFLLITPVGVMFMVMSSISGVQDVTGTFISLGLFVALNFVGMITHFIFLNLSLVALCVNPFKMLRLCLPPYFISFATTSGIVSLPKCYIACDTYGIPTLVSRLVLPFAGTMKSDASAIFIVGSVMFIAQRLEVTLDAGKVIITIILAFAYVTALPNIPSASVVAVITILNSIGVNSEQASLLFAVEWLNDRLRSGNVALSHMYCTTFTYHMCKKDLERSGEGGDHLTFDDEDDYEHEKSFVEA